MTQAAPSYPPPDPAAAVRGAADAAALVSEGLKLQQTGEFAAAAATYRRALAIKPDDFDALHLLGVIFHQCGRHAEAVQQIDNALAHSPDNVFALNNRGIVLGVLSKFEDALSSYERALALRPDYAEAWLNRGNAMLGLRRFAEAVASYDRALTLRPDCADALLNRGNALKELKRFESALQSYDAALAVRPAYPEALANRAVVLCECKRYEEALASCECALASRPDFAEAHSNRGNALHGLERYAEALTSYDRALTLRPDLADTYVNRGASLHALKRAEEALADYDRALALMPNRAETHYNRANALYTLKRFDDALASYDRALALRDTYVEALANRGVALQDLRRFNQALAAYQRAAEVRPDFAAAHYNEALCRLLLGDLAQGFDKFEWRWDTEQHCGFKRDFSQPLWTGAQELAGKTILLHAEQGFGDTIQFCRYAPMAAACCARVVLEVQEPLRALMAALPGVAEVLPRGAPLPDFDLHCPLLSLPRSFATALATVPGTAPYLHAAPEAMAYWDGRLGAGSRPRIGIAWSGRPTHKNDHNRSIELAAFLQIFAGIDARIVSLQREVREADAATLRVRSDVLHFGEELKDFSDTAALIANLDLIVAVDTSVVHLAGALAKPVWLLLPFMPDWRWLLDRDDSPWYPTARLFRQGESRRWEDVFAHVSAALRQHVGSVIASEAKQSG